MDLRLIWPVLILMCIAISIFVWIRLCDVPDVTHAHRTLIVDRLRKKLGRTGDAMVSAPWVGKLFLGRMLGAGSLSMGQRFWGGLYRTFGPILPAWKGILIAIVGGAAVLGYTSEWKAFIALGLAASYAKLPIVSSVLLTEGRREKQRAAVGAAVVAIVLLVGVASLVVGLSWCLAPFMPHALGRDYVGIDPRNICLAGVVAPWIFLLQLLCRRILSPVPKTVLRVTAVFMTVIAFSDPQLCRWLGIARPAFLGSIFVLGWAFFLAMLWRLCMRGVLTP